MIAYPLKFQPIFKSMLWGGDRLPAYVRHPTQVGGPVGEAWMLSDVEGNHSIIANGPLAGLSLREIVQRDPHAIFGSHVPPDGRFPLLLKFIDARQALSVQVHPTDELAKMLKGPGFRGKTEAWVILESDPDTSLLYAGFKAGVTADSFRQAMLERTTPDTLHRFTPQPGDCIFLESGTVHAIGAILLIFEVQQTSDITYRLYDWDRVDAKTGRPRELHVEHGLICSNFAKGPCHPTIPTRTAKHEVLVNCPYFKLYRKVSRHAFNVGNPGECRAIACVAGQGQLAGESCQQGDIFLLPASAGSVQIIPDLDSEVTVLECGLGELV